MFNVNRTEQFQISYWTGKGWSSDKEGAKLFASKDDAKQEMNEWGVAYRYRINEQHLYYCSAGSHLWYYEYDDDGNRTPPLIYNGDATDEEKEAAEERYCGCNDNLPDQITPS